MRMAVELVALAERLQHRAAHRFGLGSGLVHLGAEPLQQDHKFVPAQACHGVPHAHTAPQARSHLAQQLVAQLVPLGVIQVLEVGQIHEEQRATRPRQLENFDAEGYAFVPAASEPDRLVFRRTR